MNEENDADNSNMGLEDDSLPLIYKNKVFADIDLNMSMNKFKLDAH